METAVQSKPLWRFAAGAIILLLAFLLGAKVLTGLAPAPEEDAARAAERAKALADLQNENAQKLGTYGWVDKA